MKGRSCIRRILLMNNAGFNEVKLMKECISGDKKKWDIFIQRYSKLIYHTLYKTLRVNGQYTDPDDINDLFQEVFASFCADSFRKLRMFDPAKGCSLPSWLRMITARIAIDQLRKNKQHTSIDDLPSEPFQTGNQEAIIDEETRSFLSGLLQELPAKDKLLIELSYMRELPPEEVAQILHISVGAFYTRKNRVIEKLKKIASERNIS